MYLTIFDQLSLGNLRTAPKNKFTKLLTVITKIGYVGILKVYIQIKRKNMIYIKLAQNPKTFVYNTIES